MQHHCNYRFNKKVRIIQWIKYDNLKRTFVLKYYFKKLYIRCLLKNYKVKHRRTLLLRLKLSKYPRYSNFSQLNSRCVRTGRSHMVNRLTLLSRMQLKYFAQYGFLPSVGKFVR